jgi:hypothetical protein
MGQTEDGGVRSHAERERGESESREPGVAAKLTKPQSQVPEDVIEGCGGAPLPPRQRGRRLAPAAEALAPSLAQQASRFPDEKPDHGEGLFRGARLPVQVFERLERRPLERSSEP